jgi:NH3-dependent NAD+ synthetase
VFAGPSGGIDAACMVVTAVQVMGQENVVGLILPEKESNPISRE